MKCTEEMRVTSDISATSRLLPLRVVVVGGAAAVASLRDAITARGLGEAIRVVADAGRMTPPVLAAAAGADTVVIATQPGSGLPVETRRECLLAWGLGAVPLLAVDTVAQRDAAQVRATGEAFTAWAHHFGGPPPAWAELSRDATRIVAQLESQLTAARDAGPLRFWVEEARRDAGHAMVTGLLMGGRVVAGEAVALMPQGTRARVAAVEPSPQARSAADAAPRLSLRLDGAEGLSPGMLIADAEHRPELADQVAAHIVWSGDQPLLPGRPYEIRLGPQSATVQIGALKHKLNPADLNPIAARRLEEGEVGLANLSLSAPLLFDASDRGAPLSRFTLHIPGRKAPVGWGRIAFTLRRATNIHWQALSIDKSARSALKGQRPCCLWLTGLSGSGKSTVASLLEKRLHVAGRHTYTLDGDNVRHGLNRDLGFTDADRVENIRRVGEVARLMVDAGLIVIVSFISPFRAERQMARGLMAEGEFLEIFVDTPIEICEQRDPKGLYRKARAGGLKNFTGIDSPYERPERPDIHLKGGVSPPEALVEEVLGELRRRGLIG